MTATFLVLPIIVARPTQAQTYTVLHAFAGPPDGKYPEADLTLDAEGNLYGTTRKGGASYWGTAFKVETGGKERVLYNFLGGYGEEPLAGLFLDARGNLYGATSYGGAYNDGTVFKLSGKGHETVLYSFAGGRYSLQPSSDLVRDLAGNLYGTTVFGGDDCSPFGCGTVFKLDPSGKETVLYKFSGAADGSRPNGVIRDKAGNLYGTTIIGGSGCGGGCGTVFKLNTAGKLTVLHSFSLSGDDGANPYGSLIRDAAGNLYGTTYYGGDPACGYQGSGCGTVFMLDQAGKEKVLHAFHSTGGDGQFPVAGLIRDPAGYLYGTTPYGGSAGFGTIFKLDMHGNETLLYSFRAGWADGAEPVAGLIRDKAGNLYGTASLGGDFSCDTQLSCGVVFKLSP